MKKKTPLLILEDNEDCAYVYESMLEPSYDLHICNELKELNAVLDEKTRAIEAKLMIADLHLPDGQFLKWLEKRDQAGTAPKIPFMVVSSADDMTQLQTCFRLGAADYLTKPFGQAELTYKIHRILQSLPSTSTDIRLDHFRRRVAIDHKLSEELTPREFQIVLILAEAKKKGCQRADIVQQVWSNIAVQSKTFDVHLVHIRQKLKEVGLQINFNDDGRYSLNRVKGS